MGIFLAHIFGVGRSIRQLGILLCFQRRVRMMWKGVGSMGGLLFTDKLGLRCLKVLDRWSLKTSMRSEQNWTTWVSFSVESYNYNAVSEVLSHTVDGETTSYGYDAASQLTSEIRPGYNAGYTFDGNGNRLSKTVNGNTEFYSYDNGDKLLSAGIKTYTYDQAGRTTSVKVGMGAPSVLTYDDEDRLKTFMGQTYTYNGFDTRVGKNGTTYHRDGTGVTAPLISDSNATYTPGISERRNGVSTFLNSGLKDVAKQTDAAGVVTATRKYDAYGMVIGSTGTWKGPFGYSGSAGYQEDETGLQLLGHRYYDSSTGRFITRDPIKDGRNWYAYCGNNPVNAIDANGLKQRALTEAEKDEFARACGELYDRGYQQTALDMLDALYSGKVMIDDEMGGNAVWKNGTLYMNPKLFGFGAKAPIKRGSKYDEIDNAYWRAKLLVLASFILHEGDHLSHNESGRILPWLQNEVERRAWSTQIAFLEKIIANVRAGGGSKRWKLMMLSILEDELDRAKSILKEYGG
jgi:RHS repeat-associated protein